MKKRIISVLLTLFIILGLFPVSVQAANLIDITIAGNCNYTIAKEIADITISRRVDDGGSTLNYNKNLTEAAMHRAAEVAFYYSHTRPSGGRYYEVLKMYHTGAYSHGENIAIQYSNASSVTNAWFASEGHYNNIMNSKYKQIGVGVYSSGGITAYVQLFSDSTKDTGKTTKTVREDRKYNISTEPNHLIRSRSDLEAYYELDMSETASFSLKYYNDGYRYSYMNLVPTNFDIRDTNGKLVARLEEDIACGYYKIVPKAVGTGSVYLGSFNGDSNPTVLTVQVKDHEHQYDSVVTNPTCKEQGYTTYYCRYCDDKYISNYVDMIDHVPDNNWIKPEGYVHDCNNMGFAYCLCVYCNEPVFQKWLDKLPHEYNDFVSNGINDHKGYCTMCGLETIESHEFICKVTEPTCTTKGYDTYICKVCNYSYEDDFTDMIDHIWGEGIQTIAPTYITSGEILYKCNNCSAEKVINIPPLNNPFKDVSNNKFYYEPVLWAVDTGITAGLSEDTFGPNETCTRAQAVSFLWRAAGKPEPKSSYNPFVDIKRSDYYYKAVLWAVEKGITSGTTKNQFSPKAYCTRAQIVTFLWRANGKVAVNSTNPFYDVNYSNYYYDAVLWAVNNKITSGISSTKFGPNDNCTRGQIVTFLYRTYNS